jgi:hypothetical protein
VDQTVSVKEAGCRELLVIKQMKCGFQNGKEFADDLSDCQFLKKNVALRKKITANYDNCYAN